MYSSVARHEHHTGCGRSSLWAFWRGPWARSATRSGCEAVGKTGSFSGRSAWETMFFLPSGAWGFPVQIFSLNQSNDKWCRLGLKKARGFWMKFRSQVAFWECWVCPPVPCVSCLSVGIAGTDGVLYWEVLGNWPTGIPLSGRAVSRAKSMWPSVTPLLPRSWWSTPRTCWESSMVDGWLMDG